MRNQDKCFFKRLYASLIVTGSLSLGILAGGDTAFARSNTPVNLVSSLPPITETNLTALSIFLSTFGGMIVYSVNESWKRRQYIESKVKDFEASLETVNIRKILSSELQCIELFPFVDDAIERFVIVEDCLWTEALLECKCNHQLKEQYHRIDRKRPLYEQEPAVKSCIRDNFNRFLHHLQHFEKMIQSKALDEKKLRSYLYPWFESITQVGKDIYVECPSTKKKYTPQQALLDYMGLSESIPEDKLSIVQRDVRSLVTRYRSLSSFLEHKSSQVQSANSVKPCPKPEAA